MPIEERRPADGAASRLGSRHTEVVGGLATSAISGWWWGEDR